MSSFTFTKAERKKGRLKLGMTGPSGSGKTLSSLLIAKGIGGKIAVIDTESASASLYADPIKTAHGTITPPAFDTLNLSAPFSPERFIDAIKVAEAAGYTTLIIDSLTHEWNGPGGCLELSDQIAKSKFRGNSWSAWSEVTPRHRAVLDTIIQSHMHIIVTLRSKTETAQQESITGKKQVVKLGMKSEQRDGFEYELSIVLDLSHDGHYAKATKDRTGLLMDVDPFVITEKTGAMLSNWLESGVEPAVIEPEPGPVIEPPKTQPTIEAIDNEERKKQLEHHIERLKKCVHMTELQAVWQMIPHELRPDCDAAKNEMKQNFTTTEVA